MTKSTAFSPKALKFFRQLAKNNRRDWFQPRKEMFDELIREPMLQLVSEVADDMRKFAVDYVPADPTKVIYRIYRDTRFSKDKTPYKTHIAAHFQHQKLPKNRAAGLYFSVSYTGVEIAGGIYMPGPEELAAVRAVIAGKPKAFAKLTSDPKLVRLLGHLQGSKLARVPKGFEPDHPAAEWLRMKNFYFDLTLDSSAALKPTLRKTIVDRFKLLLPLVSYFNRAVLDSIEPEKPERPVRPEPMF
ncbi:DUF2461 domain-containing protein [soil metagenome]